jgi:phosphatidylethanolamine-binding protein (PEBP) family uncharacterized protein
MVDGASARAGAFVDLQLRSSTFRDHGPLPARYTADGAGVSPPLAWSKVPLGTRSLVLVVEDADSDAYLTAASILPAVLTFPGWSGRA